MQHNAAHQEAHQDTAKGMIGATLQIFGARVAGQAAGVVAMILLARALGPEALGLYSFTLVVAVLLAQFPGPGLDMTAVRFASRDWATQPAQARGTLLAAGLIKLGIGLILALSCVALSGMRFGPLLVRPELAWPLRVAGFGAVGLAMTEFMLAALQAREQFGQILGVSLAITALKIVPLLLLVAGGALTLQTALAAYLLMTCVGWLAATLAAWRSWCGPGQSSWAAIAELLRFARWLVAATLLGAVTSSLDVLLLSFFVGAEQTGIYAAGRTLAFPLAFIGYAISSVLLPRFSRLAPVQLGPALWRASAQIAAVAAGVAVVVALGAPLAVRLLYGERYNGAAVMVVLLTLAYLTQWVSWPATTVLLALNRPDLILLVSLAMLGLTVGGYLLAIPRLGAPGVAWVYCAGCAIMVGPYMLLARRLIRERAAPQPAREAGPLLELP